MNWVNTPSTVSVGGTLTYKSPECLHADDLLRHSWGEPIRLCVACGASATPTAILDAKRDAQKWNEAIESAAICIEEHTKPSRPLPEVARLIRTLKRKTGDE
jgi:hypothetical protein